MGDYLVGGAVVLMYIAGQLFHGLAWRRAMRDIAEIAKCQSLGSSSVRRALSKLEGDGFARHCRDTPDHPAIQVTKKGEVLMRRLFPVLNQGEQQFALCMTREEQESLASLLRKIVWQRPIPRDLPIHPAGQGATLEGRSMPLKPKEIG